ncbi:ABC transporter ATP-binding protein [Desulfosporosinus sp. BICA1-9]|uniref:ABC transporter ATP-binding protein n=1 Tax=Desulfosporosinus sp. BICA1-9 TaxID=1531958 RepID=UPI00054BC9A3|nr:ABC transporter ATP-binding protein [Desulfosporosinus sp. BICA1-9]KJS89189.1 MAG: hypothetical protein JL57_08815 [Desulfosporosinus sp. BICA1-9]HBW34065.1 ABC transporter ATP-binding protein [Desulfosporosinus sp.]
MKLFGPPKTKETLFQYLLKYKFQFIVSSLTGIIYNTAIVLGPILLGRLIDAAGGGTGQQVFLSAFFFVGVTAFFQFSRFIKRWYMRDQFNRVACDLRQTFLERTLHRTLPELEKETVGDLMSRTVGDITLVVDTVMSTINEGWDTWLLMMSYFVVLMVMDWKITLLATLLVPVTLLVAHNMRHILYNYSLDARKSASTANTGLQRYLGAISVLRLFGREASEAKEIMDAYNTQVRFNIKQMLLQQSLLPIYALLAGLGIVVVIGLGGEKVMVGDWTVGTFNAYMVMFVAFSGRTRVAAKVFNRWQGARAAWQRVKEKMAISVDSTLTTNEEFLEPIYTIKVEQLTFGFNEQPVLHNLCFEGHRGQIIGVTGAVGSGKTALVNALTGLYPYHGSITFNDEELRDLPLSTIRKRISYAGHEQFLFSMSIRDNILLKTIDENSRLIDDEANRTTAHLLDKSLKSTALYEDLGRFEHGLDTQVGEKGARVSGGQRQRIAMARAICAQADIILLDDPFSAVDIATEKVIIDHLKSDYKDQIVFLFTHRLTAFEHINQVLVLEHEKIIEQGTHADLIKQQGVYGEIYKAQVFMGVNHNEQTA